MFAIDVGNAYSVSYDGRKSSRCRSIVANPPTLKNTRSGTGVMVYDGSIYHAGVSALRYDIFTDMAVSNKEQNIRECVVLTLNLISPLRGRLDDTTELVIQVPDTSSTYAHELVKQLNGFKLWVLDGREHRTKIQVRNIYQEGYGSWYVVARTGALKKGYSLIIDIGAGTVIATLIDNMDSECIKTLSFRAKGAVYLAEIMRHDYDIRDANGGDVLSVEMLFSAFEHPEMRVGSNGISIRPYIGSYTKQWWSSIWSNILSAYSPQFQRREINKVIVTGGGAELVRPYIEAANAKVPGMFQIASDPLYDNVKGIYHAHLGQ